MGSARTKSASIALVVVAIASPGCAKREAAEDPLAFARSRIATHTVSATIAPFGLRATLPPGWTCQLSPTVSSTVCSKGDWIVWWSVDDDERTNPDAEWASARAARGLGGGSSEFVTELTLLGQRGFVTYRPFARRPGVDWTFRAWHRHPTKGQVVVRITASAFRTETHDEAAAEALSVILTTTRDGSLDLHALPSQTDRSSMAHATAAHALLAADDSSPGDWRRAARELTRDSPMLGEPLRGVSSPDVGGLLAHRIASLSDGSGEDLVVAADMLACLELWDSPRAPPEATRLFQRALAAAKTLHGEPRGKALQAATKLAMPRRQLLASAWATALADEDAALCLTHVAPFISEGWLGLGEPAALVQKWLREAEANPSGFNHAALADWVVSRRERVPRLRPFLATMLLRADRWGELEVTSEQAVFHTPHGDVMCGASDDLPPAGTHRPMQLGDVYACALRRQVVEPGYNPVWEPDARIAGRSALAKAQ